MFRNTLNFIRNVSYQSNISLKNLYPNSSLKLVTCNELQISEVHDSKFNGFIPMDKLTITYTRSSGPGGQNVNKVNTKVDVRFHVKTATWIDDDVKNKVIEMNRNRINRDGYLIVRSELTNSQHLNLANALNKIRDLVRSAAKPEPLPDPEAQALRQKRQEKYSRQRVQIKRGRGEVKKHRQAPDARDFF